MTTKIKISGGVDVGNGYVKAALRASGGTADKFDLPSGVALVTGAVDLPTPDHDAVAVTGNDFYNELDATFTSPLVHNTHRHLFGRRALRATTPRFLEFDVVSGDSKAEQQLSAILVLGVFAAKAVREYVQKNGALPEEQLDVQARVGLALPIDEFREHRSGYAAGFKKGSHLVTVHNFETPVTVKITFVAVEVTAEGASGQFAIRQHGVALTQLMIDDVVGRGGKLEGITAQDVFDARSTLAIDIGEGTVNFPVYSEGKLNVDASRTFDKGYGTVLENSIHVLKRAKLAFSTRKELADYLLSEPSPMKRAEHAKVAAIVAEQAELFAEQVSEETRQIFAEIGRQTEVVYVFGGGSGPLREALHPALLAITGESAPVLYLGTEYSRHLNREGLLIATDLAEKAAAAAAAAQKTA